MTALEDAAGRRQEATRRQHEEELERMRQQEREKGDRAAEQLADKFQ